MAESRNTFRASSITAVADPGLRSKLKRAVGHFRKNREAVYAELDDVQAYRDRARHARLRALSRLPELLEELEAKVTAAGGTVHWAKDAQEAREIVGRLVREKNLRTVVKGKSMITEEIALNPYLESLGMKVFETDLGEFIVQLAGQAPSHIISPSIHVSREEVVELFDKHLGRTDEAIEGLTAIAREVLREQFLAADLAVTGVNMAVAETGTAITVENEGNIRMSTTCAPVHVGIMSLEKVLPDLEAFSAVLEMLPRSATGQRIGTYISLFTGARREGESDGAREFHLVILDNGRSALMADPELREVLACVRCGSCLNACPVYQTVGGYSYGWVYGGPIGQLLTPLLGPEGGGRDLPSACTGCGACAQACPVGIDHPKLLRILRARYAKPEPLISMHSKLASRPRLYNAAVSLMRTLDPRLVSARLAPRLRLFARKRSLPALKRPVRYEKGGDDG